MTSFILLNREAFANKYAIHVNEINNGFCSLFGDLLLNAFPEAEYCDCRIHSHVWVKWQGRHYDAMHPYGTRSFWRLLPNTKPHLGIYCAH